MDMVSVSINAQYLVNQQDVEPTISSEAEHQSTTYLSISLSKKPNLVEEDGIQSLIESTSDNVIIP